MDMVKFGEDLRLHRQGLGWTQFELSQRSGVNMVTISRLERNLLQAVQLRTAVALAQALGQSLEAMIDFNGCAGETTDPLPMGYK